MSGIESPAPTPSVLFYLFAHRLDVSGRANRVGTATGIVPCHDEFPVQTWQPALTLLAAAFWGLREAGLIQLSVETKLLLFISCYTYVKVALLGQAESPGLEGQLLAAMQRDSCDQLQHRAQGEELYQGPQRRLKGDLTVESVVPRWLITPHSEPATHVIRAVRDTAVSLGYMDVGRPKYSPRCAKFGQTRLRQASYICMRASMRCGMNSGSRLVKGLRLA